MATNYPTGLDTLVNPTGGDTLDSPDHAAQHANANDGIEALQTKVGINGSAVTTSIDYLLKNTSSSNPGHKHTLADGATDVTATATELNKLDGVTASTAELNKVDGLTATTAELNILDGATITTSELNFLDRDSASNDTFVVRNALGDISISNTLPDGLVVGTTGTQTLTNKTLTSPVIDTSVSGTAILDEDDMSSNSATQLATQQSIKAYVDSTNDGWIPKSDTFTYDSYTASVDTGVIQVTGDVTSNYYAGQKVKFDQTTDGTKYGFITKVALDGSNTDLTIYFGNDYDLDNETISNFYISNVRAPQGFSLDPEDWTLSEVSTSTSAITSGSWQNSPLQLDIPVGIWNMSHRLSSDSSRSSATATSKETALSTTSASPTTAMSDSHRYTAATANTSGSLRLLATNYGTLNYISTTTVTIYLIYIISGGSTGNFSLQSGNVDHFIKATIAYL